MTSFKDLSHMTLPDGYDWLKSAANFLLLLDQTLLLPKTVVYTNGITTLREGCRLIQIQYSCTQPYQNIF